ncbi:MAG TPA: nucleotide pyrophosphohydrolase [Candidatus Paceibacterota bacterium]|nr:nucleotide pyrophosphohydrolase [Candidatus Paceibacterota bacterium]
MKDIENEIRAYLLERNWDKLRPGDLAKSVSIEAGELLELFQWDNPDLEAVHKDPERLTRIKQELADVMIYCIDMAVLLDLDTAALIREKLELVKKKYPAELFQMRSEDPGSEDVYVKIKKEYRTQGDL